MFWKKKKAVEQNQHNIILGMIMLRGGEGFDFPGFIKDFKTHYTEKIVEPTGDGNSAAFKIEEDTIAVGHMPIPIPAGDIEGTAKYAYNWGTAVEDVSTHQSHLIVSVLSGENDQIKRYRNFTRVISSLLRTTDAIGIYKGNQSLLIPKDHYLGESALMGADNLPINLWIYIGLGNHQHTRSGYTYGLKEFGKMELEVLDSSKSLEEIRGFLFNIAHYVLAFDVTFKDGQTVGISAEEKIKINLSPGTQVEGHSFKLAY